MIRPFLALLTVPALLLAFVLPLSSADAKTVRYNKTARAGVATKIDHYTGWNDDCSFLTIEVDVVSKPKHGSIRPKVAQAPIPRPKVGRATHCVGRPSRVVEIYYTPERGYKGRDAFKVRMTAPGQRPVDFLYNVRIR